MKKAIHILLCLIMAATLAHAQSNKKVAVSKMETTTDSLGIYAVLPDTILLMQPLRPSSFEVERKSLSRMHTQAQFKRATSRYHFPSTAKFLVYLRPQSRLEIEDIAVAQFTPHGTHRTLCVSTLSSQKSTQLEDISQSLHKTVRQLTDYKYEITLHGPSGEYCLFPNIDGTGGHSFVWDFTIGTTVPTSSGTKYTTRRRR